MRRIHICVALFVHQASNVTFVARLVHRASHVSFVAYSLHQTSNSLFVAFWVRRTSNSTKFVPLPRWCHILNGRASIPPKVTITMQNSLKP
jgi:hypothetical protein